MKLFTKTLVFMSILMTFTFTSCSEDEQLDLNLSRKKLYFSAESPAKSEVINIDGDWTFSVSEDAKDWLKVAQNNNVLYVNVTENTTRKSKEGKITITGNGETQIIDVLQKELEASIIAEDQTIDSNTKEIKITPTANIPYQVEVLEKPDWITNINTVDNNITFTLTPNLGEDERETTVRFKEIDGTYFKDIKITQKGFEGVRIPNSSIVSATDDFHETDNPNAPGWGDGGIDFALDGDFNTKFHSKYDQPLENPINLDVTFKGVEKMNYVTYYPRKGGNGAFTKVEVWYSSKTQTTLTKLMDFKDFKGEDNPTKIIFPETIKDVNTIRIKVFECKGGQNAACAELEFYYFKQ